MKDWQCAFILCSWPWSESSLMLDVFTEGSGRLRLIAKGARSRRSNLKGTLQPFTPLLLHFGGRSKIRTLYSAEAISLSLPLSGTSLYSGLYVNELISRVLEYEISFSELFSSYLHCIQMLAGTVGSLEPILRRFELALLGNLGYGVDFLHCADSGETVDDAMTYCYLENRGFIASIVIDNKTFTGRHLRMMAEQEFLDTDTLRAAKRFTRIALKPYLRDKPLKSRELFVRMLTKNKDYYDQTTFRR